MRSRHFAFTTTKATAPASSHTDTATALLHCLLLLPWAGGVGDLAYPLVSDLNKKISEAYGVLTDEGIALRGLFIIDPQGIVQHATINNLAFGRNVEETIRILAVSGACTIAMSAVSPATCTAFACRKGCRACGSLQDTAMCHLICSAAKECITPVAVLAQSKHVLVDTGSSSACTIMHISVQACVGFVAPSCSAHIFEQTD
jgi:hypothetical protein